jgi:hypothetical protein
MTISFVAALFVAAPMLASPPIFAFAAQSPVTDLHQAKSVALAGVLNSDAIIVGDDKSDAKAEALMLELMASDPDLAELESDYPGVGKEIAQAMLPIINKHMRQRLPELHARQSALYHANFSEGEIDALIKFYSSSTGQKLIAGMMENIKPDAMINEAKASEDFRFSANSALKDIRNTVPSIMSSMNDADNKALQALMETGLLPRMQKIAPKTQQIALDWMNESAPGEDEELEEAAVTTITRRMEQASK